MRPSFGPIARRSGLAAVAAIALLLAACGSSGASTAPQSAAQLIQKASTKFAQDSSLHFTLTTTGAAAGVYDVTSAEGDLQRPDKLQVTSGTDEVSQGATIGFAVIFIGTTQYLDLGKTGKYSITNALPNLLLIFDPNNGIGAILSQFQNPSAATSSTVGGVACWKTIGQVAVSLLAPFTGNSTPGNGTVQTTLWIGQSDGQIHQVQLVGAAASGDTAQTTRVITLSKFNESISIVAPSVSGS
jgi:hypothetical protein